jgi:hypothetical protein
MTITKDNIRNLFTHMALAQVSIRSGEILRRSARVKQLELLKEKKIDTVNEETIYEIEPVKFKPVQFKTDQAEPDSKRALVTPIRPPPITYQFTTVSKQIYDIISPDKQEQFIRALQKDDSYIKRVIISTEEQDELFNDIDKSEMGVYLEEWICSNLLCPGCNEGQLYKYVHPNMPVIDVACINPLHVLSHGPRYYQIKASQQSGVGMKYFSRIPISYSETGYIKVGSKKYGKFSHEVLVTEQDDKDLVIGYICISYIDNKNMTININPNDSFILIPNLLHNTINTNATHHSYYKYLYTNNSTLVSYNSHYVMAFSLNEYFDLTNSSIKLKNININYRFDYSNNTITIDQILNTQTTPPIPQTPLGAARRSSFEKYMIYKMKYLRLKSLKY